jgi:hypothetical protein
MNYVLNLIKESLESSLYKKDVQYFSIGVPFAINLDILERGIVILQPVATTIEPVATGMIDNESKQINIILAKNVQDEFTKNAQKESGTAYLVRVMENKTSLNELEANTIRYVVRNNLPKWGLLQPEVSISYDDNAIENLPMGSVTATLSLTVDDHMNQALA